MLGVPVAPAIQDVAVHPLLAFADAAVHVLVAVEMTSGVQVVVIQLLVELAVAAVQEAEATAVGPVVIAPGQVTVVPPLTLGVHDATPTEVCVVWQLVTAVVA